MLITTHNTAKALDKYAKKIGRTQHYSMLLVRDLTAAINAGHRSPFINEIRRMASIAEHAVPTDRSKLDDTLGERNKQQRKQLAEKRKNNIINYIIKHPSLTRRQIVDVFAGTIPANFVLETIIELKFENKLSFTYQDRCALISYKMEQAA